jgi:hypothetical protein
MKTNTLGHKFEYEDRHFPENAVELQQLIKELTNKNESYYVVSRGNNWGYGCHASNTNSKHCIVLSEMNKIIELNLDDGLVTLEPGVSYGQLCDFLEANGNNWIAPVHGGGANCSVVGNVLERGYGITPIMDHFQACQSIKAILPNGLLYTSPLHAIKQNKLAGIFRSGIGPYLDGIFTQSNFGIVSEMTIKLAPKSEVTELFFIDISEDELETAIHSIKRLKRKFKSVLGGINLMNSERILSMTIPYPEEDIRKRQMLSNEYINKNIKTHLIPAWTIIGAFYGDKEMVNAAKKITKREFKYTAGKRIFLNSFKMKLLDKVSSYFPKIFNFDLQEKNRALQGLLKILNGVPQDTALKLAYWKNLNDIKRNDLNPTEDDCGLIWYAPLVEMKPSAITQYVAFIEDVSKRFDFNPLITLTTLDDMCFDSTIPILFNKNDLEDQKKAHNYFNTLLKEGADKGFFPYRLGTNSMDVFTDNLDSDYHQILNLIKNAVDSKRLFAEGRYVPKEKNIEPVDNAKLKEAMNN